MHWIDLGTGVALLNSQVVPISQVVLKAGVTVDVYKFALFKVSMYWQSDSAVPLSCITT